MKSLVIAILVVGIIGTSTAFSQAPQELRIGNNTANDTQAEVNDKFSELLSKYSDGRLKAAAFHGEALGNTANMIRGVQGGSIHGMIFASGFLSSIVPELGLLDMPFLMPKSAAQITAFMAQSKGAAAIVALASEKGIHILGFYGIGPQSMLTNFPLEKLSDLQGKKFRVIPSPTRQLTYRTWGAVPRPMEFGEVYTALQQRTIDGMENGPDVIFKMKHHEAARFYTLTEHFGLAANIIVSKKWYDSLPNDLKDVVRKAGAETIVWADDAYSKSQVEGLEALKKAISVRAMPPDELQKMKDLAYKGVWQTMEKDPKMAPVFTLLQEDVARFNKR